MKLLLSGEGKTDMGYMKPTAEGMIFVPGPMARIVDVILEKALGYSLLDTDTAGGECVRFISESELLSYGRSGPMLLRGLKSGRDTAYFTRNAQVLGRLARNERGGANVAPVPVIAVLFRDADKTRSSTRNEWQDKFDSILRGFKLADFSCGVPMVPRPKSEAWLLCGLQSDLHGDCATLENAPGNDGSPHALKDRLRDLIGHAATAEEQTEWITSGRIDPEHIDMPSYAAFRAELTRALEMTQKDISPSLHSSDVSHP